jgi:hypothetical protein
MQLLIYAIPLLVIALGLILWTRRQPNASAGRLISGTAPFGTQASADQSLPADGNPPDGWEYDAEKNRFYDPNHSHWHNGPPPPENQRAAAGRPATGNPVNPGIINPQPWQYDAATNQHWDPSSGHNHWHPGQPPPADQRASASVTQSGRQPPNIANPTPFQYDEASNQYYDPAHGHWHRGQPPADQGSP